MRCVHWTDDDDGRYALSAGGHLYSIVEKMDADESVWLEIGGRTYKERDRLQIVYREMERHLTPREEPEP